MSERIQGWALMGKPFSVAVRDGKFFFNEEQLTPSEVLDLIAFLKGKLKEGGWLAEGE